MTLPRFIRKLDFRKNRSYRRRQKRQKNAMNILVVRPDRLGDVILSTPALEVIKRFFPKARLTLLVKGHVKPLLEGLSTVDQIIVYEPEGKHAGIRGFFNLLKELQQGHFRYAIVLKSQWTIGLALLVAGIRNRIGPLSKPHSFLFYNRGMRQRRSQVEMHEADYNLQLLHRLGIRVGSRTIPTRIHIPEKTLQDARTWLIEKGWSIEAGPLVVIHPGMGGSALNWPESHYHELARALATDGLQILITGGPSETDLIDRMEKELSLPEPAKIYFYRNSNGTSIDFLAALLTHASLVVAPSTGPLHLAVALDRPVLTFYPPIRVQSAIRWGPYLADESRASVLVPEVYCGQDFHCLGSLCHYFPCMKSLTVNQAINQTRLQLRLSNPHPNQEKTDAKAEAK